MVLLYLLLFSVTIVSSFSLYYLAFWLSDSKEAKEKLGWFIHPVKGLNLVAATFLLLVSLYVFVEKVAKAGF